MKKFRNILITAMVFLSIGSITVKANEKEEIITAYINILKSSQYQDDGAQECKYIIYDIDKNDIPELIVDIGESERERKMYFYTFEDGQAKSIGDRGGSHSYFASIPDKNGIMIITAHSSRQYAGIVSVVDGAINEEELFYKYLTPEEYIAHNDGYYKPDELYNGSVELNFIGKNDLSGLKNYNYGSLITHSSSTENDIFVKINNQKIQFDVPPQIINDRTMVPMRTIFETLGYGVEWEQNTKTITSTNGDTTIKLTIDSNTMYVNGKTITLDSPACVVEDRTLVPVRAISEASGYDVQWDEKNKIVIISTNSNQTLDNSQNTTDYKIKLGEGAPAQYGATHFITPEQVIEAVYNEYGVVAKHISTGNTTFEFEGNGTKFRVDRWYSTPEIDIKDLGLGEYFNSSVISEQENPFINLKNLLVAKGTYDSGLYTIQDIKNDNNLFFELSYVGDAINMTFVGTEAQNKAIVTLLLYEDGSNVLSTTIEYSNGTRENLTGCYNTKNSEFSTLSGSVSITEENLNSFWASIFNGFDNIIMKYSSDITLSDFGINYYVYSNKTDDSPNNNRDSFYNAIDDVNKVKEYINKGLYLEASNLCDFVKENYNISESDKNLFSSLKQEAQNRYDEYIAEQKKWKEYYYDDWCIGFTGLASYKPAHFEGGDYIQVYNSNGSTIDITSYKIGTVGDSGKLTSNIKECAKLFETIVRYPTDSFEILSETDTSAGDFEAYQRTYRITEYTNRYKTKADYEIIRHIVFKYGDWIYLINAEQNKYIWDDDFYVFLEKVRTSIKFY